MKQSHLLILLLFLATGAGFILHWKSSSPDIAEKITGTEQETITSFLQRETGLDFLEAPEIKVVSAPELIAAVKSSLDKRFGTEGLQHRNRVFELLALLPPGHLLEEEWIIAESAAKPGWFDPLSGIIYLHEQFQGVTPAEQATLIQLKTRALLHQHSPPPETAIRDDARNMREAIHGGIASIMEGRFRSRKTTAFPLPTSAEMEREAALLSLPIYLHNLVQLPSMQGKDFIKKQLAEGKTIRTILNEAPPDTLALFSEEASSTLAPTPKIPDALLRESLGAYTTQLIGERLEDYLTAEILAESWRGDEYLYFKNDSGENLYWISIWDSVKTADQFAALMQEELIQPSQIKETLTNPFIKSVDGSVIIIYHSSPETLKELILPLQLNN